MTTVTFRIQAIAGFCAAALVSVAPYGIAQQSTGTGAAQSSQTNAQAGDNKREERSDAAQHIAKAQNTVQQMKKDPQIAKLM